MSETVRSYCSDPSISTHYCVIFIYVAKRMCMYVTLFFVVQNIDGKIKLRLKFNPPPLRQNIDVKMVCRKGLQGERSIKTKIQYLPAMLYNTKKFTMFQFSFSDFADFLNIKIYLKIYQSSMFFKSSNTIQTTT